MPKHTVKLRCDSARCIEVVGKARKIASSQEDGSESRQVRLHSIIRTCVIVPRDAGIVQKGTKEIKETPAQTGEKH
jgi:hypothetical protein